MKNHISLILSFFFFNTAVAQKVYIKKNNVLFSTIALQNNTDQPGHLEVLNASFSVSKEPNTSRVGSKAKTGTLTLKLPYELEYSYPKLFAAMQQQTVISEGEILFTTALNVIYQELKFADFKIVNIEDSVSDDYYTIDITFDKMEWIYTTLSGFGETRDYGWNFTLNQAWTANF